MEIEGEHTVDAGARDQVGDELGGDRRARPDLSVLARVAEIGDHRRDAPRRGAAQRVDDDQQLHQVVVRRIGGRLQHEHVGPAHVLLDLDEHLHVGEAPHHRPGERPLEVCGDGFRERAVGIAGDEPDRSVIGRGRPRHAKALSRRGVTSRRRGGNIARRHSPGDARV